MEESPHLLGLLRGRRVALILGGGGVGKTTVSAAVALAAARSGRRVLVLTVDPSNRLKSALGLSGLPGVEEAVDLGTEVPVSGGSLHAMILDAPSELARLIQQQVPSVEAQARITTSVFYREAAGKLVGTHEYLAILRLLECVQSGRHDLVVLDTPPDRHVLDFLDAPSRLEALLTSDAFRLFVAASSGVSRIGIRALRFPSLLLRGLGRFAGEEAFLSVLDFLLALSPLFDALRDRASRMRAILSSDATVGFLVCRPSVTAGVDVHRALTALQARQIHVAGVFVNGVHAWPPPPCDCNKELLQTVPFDAATIKDAFLTDPSFGLVDAATLRSLAGQTLSLAAQYRRMVEDDQPHVRAVIAAVRPVPVFDLPLFGEEIRDIHGLTTFSRILEHRAAT